LTCSSRCRQRRHRGGDLAYLAGLISWEQREQRQWHDAVAADIQTHKDEKAAMLKRREANRQRRQERLLIEALGRAELEKLRASGDYETIVGSIGEHKARKIAKVIEEGLKARHQTKSKEQKPAG